MSRNRLYEIGVGCLLVVAGLVFAVMAIEIGAVRSFADTITVTARIQDAAGLEPGAKVSVAGVEVGSVDAMVLDFDTAVVTLRLRTDAKVGADASVRIRQKSLLGEKYIELSPGVRGGPLLADAGEVRVDGPQTEIDELLARMTPLLNALDDPRTQAVFVRVAERLESDPELLPRLVDNLDTTLANTAVASNEFGPLLAEGRTTIAVARRTLDGVGDRADEARGLLRKADATLATVDRAAAAVPELAQKVDVILEDGRVLTGSLKATADKANLVLDNFAELDEVAIRRLLREEGVLVRLVPRQVDPDAKSGEFRRRGRVK
jgi:phospholipid/cholesterol/gamma-HCH transport system substrate-binding protein